MIINSIAITKTPNVIINKNRVLPVKNGQDSFECENRFLNKKPLVDRKIISQNQNINEFLADFSRKIFPNSNLSNSLFELLKKGYISFSSSVYSNIRNPKSAIAIRLDEKKSNVQNCALLEEYIKQGIGVGINFSNIAHPIEKIKYINNYFKYREPEVNRPPAGIALLNINHRDILDFISLKDNESYDDWCFDLSVVMDDEFLSRVDSDSEITLDDGTKISAKEIYIKLLNSMRKKGEPAIIFSNDKDFICDSCAASKLEENEGLTLAQVNLSRFYDEKNKKIDYNLLSYATNILALGLENIAPNGFISILGYQDLLNKMGYIYGSKQSLELLEKCLSTINYQAIAHNIRTCISPSGTTSRILKTTPSIEPVDNENATYWNQIDTMAIAQKYLDGGISKTINLKPQHTIFDIDLIIRACQKNGIKGISVFPIQ